MTLAAIIFDWAGTMVDFGSLAPVDAMRAAFEAEGVAVNDVEIRAGMGLPKRDHVQTLFAAPRVAAAWRAAHGEAPGEAETDQIFQALEPLMQQAGAQRADLIPGVLETVRILRARDLRIGSTTGYTRAMMAPIADRAAALGYAPDVIVCAGETQIGRPSPLMIWKALADMSVWPTSAVVKVDDAPAGIAEGKNAGCLTIGVAASGNALGLEYSDFLALELAQRDARLTSARVALLAAGADLVIDTVADLPAALVARGLI
ncbi:MAG: phosphonoacetaldehyde hydrolase [Caulobacterales bacterium]|jgi:phosphonoacetaldehyde hydrolase